ncbi:MAG: DUF2974 domain-containing protein [Lachnospiraceae bacterium]|nr:DUF2974 domain-containing protein [Lachnospiraceae bacterium]
MDNLITYVKFRGDLSFKQQKFNENDAMVLVIVTSIDYEDLDCTGMTIAELSKAYTDLNKKDEQDECLDDKEAILKLAAVSARYKDIPIERYVRDIDQSEEKTFYAMTFTMGRFEKMVVFRGTDGSILSWKENFNTIHTMPTPGQYSALKYLQEDLSKPFVKVSVAGHSKGGNLAVYAAMSLEDKLRKKLKKVYAFDAPGFPEDISEKLGYLAVKDRLEAYVPESCVIGNLMKPPFEKIVVKGIGKGVYQHDMFNWELTATGISMAESTNLFSTELSAKVNNWIEGIPLEDRGRVVGELFDVFSKNGITHITDLMHMDLKKIVGIIKCATLLSSENRTLLGIIIKELR